MKKLLNFGYGAIHGTYWMYYGVIYSFASVFLLGRGYTNSQIGLILAAGNILSVVMQPFLADFADRTKKISLISIIEIMTVMLMIMTFGSFILKGASGALTVIYVMMIAWESVLQPFLNSLNFKLQESGIYVNFGITRSFGSFTYAILCAFLGGLVEKFGINILPQTGEVTLVLLILSLIFTKNYYKKAKAQKIENQISQDAIEVEKAEEESEEINLVAFAKRHKVFFIVNLGVVGVYFSNQILNSFMLQIVTNVGGTSDDMGKIFGVLAFLEIPTMVCFDKLRTKFRCESMLKLASVCYLLEIFICYMATNVITIYLAMLLQLLSFGLFMPAMVHFIDSIMSKGEAVKGQSLYIMMVTITGVIASAIGGIIIDNFGVSTLTLASTIATAIGTLILVLSIEKVK